MPDKKNKHQIDDHTAEDGRPDAHDSMSPTPGEQSMGDPCDNVSNREPSTPAAVENHGNSEHTTSDVAQEEDTVETYRLKIKAPQIPAGRGVTETKTSQMPSQPSELLDDPVGQNVSEIHQHTKQQHRQKRPQSKKKATGFDPSRVRRSVDRLRVSGTEHAVRLHDRIRPVLKTVWAQFCSFAGRVWKRAVPFTQSAVQLTAGYSHLIFLTLRTRIQKSFSSEEKVKELREHIAFHNSLLREVCQRNWTLQESPQQNAGDDASRSLGDQSTFGTENASSVFDAGIINEDTGLDIADLSRYEVQETLGKGGMGEVQLATDTRLNRKVAIKRMLGDATRSKTAMRRFLTEAQSIAALNHFNIVQIHDYGRDKDGPFLIMEYVEGGSLLDKCREGALPLEEAVELTCQLCDGLSKAHDAGIIHRDIKPANILLTTDGLPKLTDFGLARQDTGESGMTLTGAVLGTPDFMSPEQRRDATLTDARSDQWSLAATVYQMVTGKSPKVIRMDTVPTALQPVLIKALEEEQDDRYRSLKDFRGALRQVVEERTTADDTLTEDVCPSCKRLIDSDRAFCLNCGTSLNASCLSCGSTFRCWDHACGHCGAGQSTLLENRHREIGAQRDLAVELLKKNNFVAAESIAKTCCEMQEWRFRRWNVWGRKFKQEVARQKHDANQRCVTILQEATVHEMSGRYDQCLTVLEQVPHSLRSLRMSEALETAADMAVRLQKKNAAAIRLQSTIDEQISTGHYVGVSTLIHELCDIAPERNDAALTRLARQVRGMEETADEVLMEFSAFRRQSRFASALKAARRLPQEFLTREFVVMQEAVKNEAVLREQAWAGLSEARLLITPPGPLNVIYRITLTRWCVREAPAATDAFSAFRSDRFAVPFVDECIPVRKYNATLNAESITDTEFAAQIDETETFLTDLRDQARRSVRWLPLVVVFCLAIILGAGFKQIDDLSKNSELQAAVLAEQWDTVLELDRTHVQALIERARRTLAEESPDLESVFSDLWYAEYHQPDSTGLVDTKVSALCVRAIFHVQRYQLNAACDDLNNAQQLDADHIRLNTARTAVAELCLVRAQSNLNLGNSDAAITFCNQSEKYGMVPARTEPTRRRAQQMTGNR